MNYHKFRKEYSLLIYYFGFFAITLSALLIVVWKEVIFVVLALIAVSSALERIFVKCPNCKRRPGRMFMRFPEICRHCETVLE